MTEAPDSKELASLRELLMSLVPAISWVGVPRGDHTLWVPIHLRFNPHRRIERVA